MKNVTLVVNTLNEEKNISDCINSAKSIAEEIIICDMYSDDRTIEIAKDLGAKIFFHDRTGFVEPARHFAISKASNEWILVLDADEKLTTKLSDELEKIVKADSADLVLFASLYNYFGKNIKYGGFFNNNWPRFFKKSKYLEVYSKEEEMVHNNFGNLRNHTKRKIQLSKEYYILHNAYPTFEKYLIKTLDNYSIIESRGRHKVSQKISFIKVFLTPMKEFLMRYLIWQGFREGKIGLILCYLKSQHTFYVLLNLWFLNREASK